MTVELSQIVDCVLPEQSSIDKSKQAVAHIRTAAKISALDCDAKGGIYTDNKLADAASALKVWAPMARAGDLEAQFYVGEIYEKGMGRTPDKSLAATWYLRAAEKGYAPAQMSLGRLYELGEGVEKNLSKAMSWYQKASGLSDEDIHYSRTFAKTPDRPVAQTNSSDYSAKQQVELTNIEQMMARTEMELKESVTKSGNLGHEIRTLGLEIKKLSVPIKLDSTYIPISGVPIMGLKNKTKKTRRPSRQEIIVEIVKKEPQAEILKAPPEVLSGRVKTTKAQAVSSNIKSKAPVISQNIKYLKVQLQQKEEALAVANSQSEALRDQLVTLEFKRNTLAEKVSRLIPEDGPVIALRWPEYKKVAGVYQAVVAAGSRVNVVGAVYPHKLITQLQINGENEEFDENGLFLKSVEISNEPVYLDIVASDNEGRTSKALFVIEADDSLAPIRPKTQALATNKIDFGKYYALVIGNSQYDEAGGWIKLDTTVNDAHAVSKLLTEKYDFDVTTIIDVDHDTLLLALESIRQKLTEKDNLLIYYAGHGHIDPENDQGYWIPVDASVKSSLNWVSNSTITDQVRAMTARNVMIVADSCYSSTLMRSGVVSLRSGLSLSKKIERLSHDIQTITRVALSAGGLQPVADSVDNSGHSVFANAFLSVLGASENILDGDSLATQIGFIVSTATQDNIKQVPRYAPLARGGHQGGAFYFVPITWKKSDI